MKKLVVVGASGHAKVAADAALSEGKFHLLGFTDNEKQKGERVFQDYEVIGTSHDLLSVKPDLVFVAIGDNAIRERVVRELNGFHFATIIHPNATIARNVEIGSGTFVAAGAVLNSCAKIGDHCILNTSSSLDHESVVDDFASIAPGVVAGGGVTIGRSTAVSIGAVLKHRVSIGANSVVGAGAVVLQDIPPNVVTYGCPARIVRKRTYGEKYL